MSQGVVFAAGDVWWELRGTVGRCGLYIPFLVLRLLVYFTL